MATEGQSGPAPEAPTRPQEHRRSLLGSAAGMTSMTILSRVLGLVREQVRGYYLGTGAASDAFGLASTIPNLFRRLFAEGAMTAALVPVYISELKKGDRENLNRFLSSFLTLFTVFMLAFTVLMMVLTPLFIPAFFGAGFANIPGKTGMTTDLTVMMFPYLFFVSLAAVVQGILNSHRIFMPSAFTPVLLNLFIIGSALLLHDWFPNAAYALALGFLLGGVAQLVYQLPHLRRLGHALRPLFSTSHPALRTLVKTFIPGVFSAGIYQINVTVSQIIASGLEPGSIASLQYSTRLQELVLGIFVASVTTVVLPMLAKQVADRDGAAVEDTLDFALKLCALAALPSTLGLLLLGEPIVRLLFGYGSFDAESVRLTVRAISFHALGIYFISASRTLSQVFYANKDLRTPTWTAAISMVANIVLCLVLSGPLSNGGIALANSASAAVSMLLLLALLGSRCGTRLPWLRHGLFLVKALLATAAMALVVTALKDLLPFQAGVLWLALSLVVSGLAGLAAFALAFALLSGQEGRRLFRAVLRKTGK
jgi:putative peptidoglycan lipid II flippase